MAKTAAERKRLQRQRQKEGVKITITEDEKRIAALEKGKERSKRFRVKKKADGIRSDFTVARRVAKYRSSMVNIVKEQYRNDKNCEKTVKKRKLKIFKEKEEAKKRKLEDEAIVLEPRPTEQESIKVKMFNTVSFYQRMSLFALIRRLSKNRCEISKSTRNMEESK